jgi:hypothetical protein
MPRQVGSRNEDELNRLLTCSVMVRRRKAEVLQDLPAKMRKQVRNAGGGGGPRCAVVGWRGTRACSTAGRAWTWRQRGHAPHCLGRGLLLWRAPQVPLLLSSKQRKELDKFKGKLAEV